jgi:hypothetical protein
MAKNIEVSDEMYEFLINLSNELNTQDNRCTATPYFFQIQHKKERTTAEGCGETVWVLDGEIHLRTDEDIKKAVFKYKEWDLKNEEDKKKFDELHEYEIEEILENKYQKFDVTTDYIYSNAFLTEKACKQHIEANSHHYTEPRDFLTYAFRNPELKKVFEFLSGLTQNSNNLTK